MGVHHVRFWTSHAPPYGKLLGLARDVTKRKGLMEDSFAQRAALLLRRLLWNLKFPPGNYYSPIPSNKDINSRRAEIFTDRQDLPGIDLRETAQLELVAELAHLYREFPYLSSPTQALRYNPNNAFFGAGDGVMLYSMLRH